MGGIRRSTHKEKVMQEQASIDKQEHTYGFMANSHPSKKAEEAFRRPPYYSTIKNKGDKNNGNVSK